MGEWNQDFLICQDTSPHEYEPDSFWCPYTHVSRANFFVLDTFPSKTVAFERSRQVDIICTEELDVTPSTVDQPISSFFLYQLRAQVVSDASGDGWELLLRPKSFGCKDNTLCHVFLCDLAALDPTGLLFS